MNDNPKQLVEDGYDQVAQQYAQLENDVHWPRMRWLTKLLGQLEPGASVLDLGCGSGDPACVAAAERHQVTGIDISQTQIELAKQNVPSGTFIYGDVGAAQFEPNAFDAVMSFYTLEHIPRKEHAGILAQIHQWLKPSGLLLLSIEAADYNDVTGDWLGVQMFISCFDPATMKQMVQDAGFEFLETAIEPQVEQDHEVNYLWVLARKR